MKIYVVSYGYSYTGSTAVGTFSSRELADSYLAQSGYIQNTEGRWETNGSLDWLERPPGDYAVVNEMTLNVGEVLRGTSND